MSAFRSHARLALGRVGITRPRLASAWMCCQRQAMTRSPHPLPPRRGGRILAYHAVGQSEWGFNDLSPARFRRQLESALDARYRFVTARHIALTGGAPDELAITFDDGLKSVCATAAPILQEMRIPFTVFAVSRWADGTHPYAEFAMNWRDLEAVAKNGAQIGSHSATHPNFARITPEIATGELVESRETILKQLGIDVVEFAIPFGQQGDWNSTAQQLAQCAGYEVIYSQAETTAFPGTISRTKITKWDNRRVFIAALEGRFDAWEERY